MVRNRRASCLWLPCWDVQEALIAEIVDEHAGVEAERREAVIRAEDAERELADAHRAARMVAIGAQYPYHHRPALLAADCENFVSCDCKLAEVNVGDLESMQT